MAAHTGRVRHVGCGTVLTVVLSILMMIVLDVAMVIGIMIESIGIGPRGL